MLPEIPMIEFFVDRIGMVDFHVAIGIAVHEFDADKTMPGEACIKAEERVRIVDKIPEAYGIFCGAVVLDAAFGMAARPVIGSEREMSLRKTNADTCPYL